MLTPGTLVLSFREKLALTRQPGLTNRFDNPVTGLVPAKTFCLVIDYAPTGAHRLAEVLVLATDIAGNPVLGWQLVKTFRDIGPLFCPDNWSSVQLQHGKAARH